MKQGSQNVSISYSTSTCYGDGNQPLATCQGGDGDLAKDYGGCRGVASGAGLKSWVGEGSLVVS